MPRPIGDMIQPLSGGHDSCGRDPWPGRSSCSSRSLPLPVTTAGTRPSSTKVSIASSFAMIRVWDQTNDLYFQCIGAFAISNGTISNGGCDSAEIDSDADGQLDTSCSLSTSVPFNASIN